MAQSDWTRLGGISRDTYVATGANVEAYVSAQIGATYKAKGSLAFANLPTPGESYDGFVYNVTDAFTTTAAFVEGAGKNYPAGTNVVCVNTTGSTYAWDVLTGIVDLSGKQDKITASGILKGDGSGGVSAATAGTDYVAPSALDGYVPTTRKVNGKALSSDVTISASDIASPATSGSGTLADWVQMADSFMVQMPSATEMLAMDSAGNVYKGPSSSDTVSEITVGGTAVVAGISGAASAAAAAAATAANHAAARQTTLKNAIDTMYSRSTYPDKASLYAALANMDDLADTLADLILALRGFCDAS